MDRDGDLVIVIGEGGWRSAESLGQITLYRTQDPSRDDRRCHALYELKMQPWTLVGAFCYKGEWHLLDLCACDKDWWTGAKPLKE